MEAQTWQRVRALFERALMVSAADRAELIRELAGGDEVIADEARRLLELHESESRFFEASDAFNTTDEFEARLPTGSRFGPYELQEVVGAGGMGVVYRALRIDGFRKTVAIKVIKRGLDSGEVEARFRQERELLAQLEHPNIARLHDGGSTDDGRPYFVMEFVDGARIDLHCDDQALTIDARIDLFLQVCDAVEYAHRHHIVHRDLKPGNVVVTRDGTPKLLDFGIAKVLLPEVAGRRSEDVTQTKRRRYTPLYASPEQVRGERVTTATDVYLLGLLLFELLTGRRAQATESDSPAEIEKSICERSAPRMSEVVTTSSAAIETASIAAESDAARPVSAEELARRRLSDVNRLARGLAGDLDTIVAMALRKEPERRYESVREFADDLRRHRTGMPVRARADAVGYRVSKFVRRNRSAVTLAIASVVVVAAVITAFKQVFDRSNSDLLASAMSKVASRKAEELWLGRLRTELPEMKASGARYSRSTTRLDYPRWCADYLAKLSELGLSVNDDSAIEPFRRRFTEVQDVRPDVASVVLRGVEDLCGQLFHSLLPYVEIERDGGTIPVDHRFTPAVWKVELATARRDFDERPELRGLWPRLRALVDELPRDPLRRRIWDGWVHWWTTKTDPTDEFLDFERELHGEDLLWAADLVRLNRKSVGALPLLERAALEDPSSFWAHFQLARAYRKIAENEGVQSDTSLLLSMLHYQAATGIQPRSSWAFTNLGEATIELATHWAQRSDQGTGEAKDRASRERDHWIAYSVAAYEHAIEIDPRAVAVRVNLGNAVGQTDPARAERLYKEALSISPDYRDAVERHAELLRVLHRGEEEIVLWNDWLRGHRDDAAGWLELAKALRVTSPDSSLDAWIDALENAAAAIAGADDGASVLKSCADLIEDERKALEAVQVRDDVPADVPASASRLLETFRTTGAAK